jgi:hypothetical protein
MYVDDSGSLTLSAKAGPYYVLSGIIIHEIHLQEIEKKLRKYKTNNFVGKYANDEVHVYNIANRKDNFNDIDCQTRTLLLRNLYNTINEMPITIICVAIDKHQMQNSFSDWKPLASAWIFITERFDRYISQNNENLINKGIIIVDKSSPSIDQVATRVINHIRQFGSNAQPINHIVEEPMFISSDVSEQMQIADASAYCTMKYLQNHPVFMKYWYVIHSKLRRAPDGDPNGYGLKIFPPKKREAIW